MPPTSLAREKPSLSQSRENARKFTEIEAFLRRVLSGNDILGTLKLNITVSFRKRIRAKFRN